MSDHQQPIVLKAELLLDSRSMLGEGAIWNHKTQELYWVDIEAQLLHWFDPLTSTNQTAHFGQKISAVIPGTDDTLLLALKDGVYSYEKLTGLLRRLLSNPENYTSGNRFNDGKCDPSGRLWLGTMGASRSAALYRIDADLSMHRMETGITTSNGIAWSDDKKTMYYIDTSVHKVVAYSYDDKTGRISTPYDAITIPEDMGKPDGCSLDAEGMIWIALWGGYAVGRWDPRTGVLRCRVEVPAKNVTSCAFGGENLDTLYITTARTSTSEAELFQCPYSGGMFTVKPGVKGIPANHFIKRTK